MAEVTHLWLHSKAKARARTKASALPTKRTGPRATKAAG
jgi:hypothetical protein